MNQSESKKELRQFGFIVGGIFVLIGVWPVAWHGAGPRLWAVGLGSVLLLLGSLAPTLLLPVFRIWMRIGHILGWINTRIILGILFYGLITPMGFVMRLFGWDAMRRTLARDAQTYRVLRQARPRSHMTRQF